MLLSKLKIENLRIKPLSLKIAGVDMSESGLFKVENNSFELTRIFKESFIDQRWADDGVDAETSLSLSLHLYLSSPPLHFILTLTFGQ